MKLVWANRLTSLGVKKINEGFVIEQTWWVSRIHLIQFHVQSPGVKTQKLVRDENSEQLLQSPLIFISTFWNMNQKVLFGPIGVYPLLTWKSAQVFTII